MTKYRWKQRLQSAAEERTVTVDESKHTLSLAPVAKKLKLSVFGPYAGELWFLGLDAVRVNRSEVNLEKNRLKIAKKCGLYLDILSCVKMNIFRSFFAFMLEMHVRCDNQYKSGAVSYTHLTLPTITKV